MNTIHENAIIEDGVSLGDNITIEAFAIVKSGAIIGDGCVIQSFSTVYGSVKMGENNKVFPHASIGSIPEDLKYDGEKTGLIIGDNNTFREYVSVNTGTITGNQDTIIGNDNLLMGHVHIGHDCIIKNSVIISHSAILAGHVEVESNAIIGGASATHQFCKIGRYAMIGGGAILVNDLPPFCICEGNRAVVKSINITGLRRNFSKDEIEEVKTAYKSIFKAKGSHKDNAQTVLRDDKGELSNMLALFVTNTTRGILFNKGTHE